MFSLLDLKNNYCIRFKIENEIEAVKSFRNIGDECGEFKDFTGEYKITETEGNVIVTLYADCTEKEALIKVTFVDNSATYNLQRYQLMNQYGYSEEQADEALSSQGMYPYKSTDVEIAANMTFEDKMKAAGTNTLIGMATVFVVLIFISFIIYLLKFVPGFFDKEAKAAKKAAKKAEEAAKAEPVAETKEEDAGSAPAGQIVDIVKTETGESVMNDSELVAVITAAVAAASAGQNAYTTYPSKDKLVTRPIRRIKR